MSLSKLNRHGNACCEEYAEEGEQNDKDVVEGGEDWLHDGLKPRTYAVDIAEGEGEVGASSDE